jgi:ABC-type bacteriocin/lantibiotic exporter with double-glycine peptidase domain
MPLPPVFRQESEDSCALACLRMVLAQHGIEVPERLLADQADKQTGGVDIEDLPPLARKHGLRAELVQLDFKTLTAWIAQRIYPIVYLNRVYFGKNVPLSRKVALSSAIVHAVVPVRLSAHFVTFHDPLKGERRRVSRKRFEAAQRDLRFWCIVCRP